MTYKIATIGDQHGNIENFYKLIDFLENTEKPDIYIQLGDLGLMGDNFQKYINKLNKKFKSINKKLFFIDGNHENHKWLLKQQIPENDFTEIASNIFHIRRGTKLSIFNKNFLFIGGAYSIDRHYRKLNKSYWLEETIRDEDLDYALSHTGKIDYLICHDSPQIPFQFYLKNKINGKDDLNSYTNRAKLQTIWDKYEPDFTIHGHYHHHYNYEFDEKKFIGLDCDVSAKIKNDELLKRQFYIIDL